MSVSLSGLQFDVARPPSRYAVVKSAVARAGHMRRHMDQGTRLGVREHPQRSVASLFDIANATAHVRGSLKITASVASRSVPETDAPPNLQTRNLACGAYAAARLCCPVAVRPQAFCFFMSVLLRHLSAATREAPTLDAHGLHLFGDPLRTRGAGSKSASRTSGWGSSWLYPKADPGSLPVALGKCGHGGHQFRGIGWFANVHLKPAFQGSHAILGSRVRRERNGGDVAHQRL
jgi:hypothetical protein